MFKIEKFFLLEHLSNTQSAEIQGYFKNIIKFKKNEIIYSAENFKNALGYILKGKAYAVTDNTDGVIMQKFCGGSVFGVASLFGGEDRYVSEIIAESDMEVLFLSEEVLREIFKKYPQASINYIAFLSDRIRFLNKRLSVISCTSSENTLLKYLNNLKDQNNTVKIPVSMTTLSKTLGLGRATLYRSLDALERKGKIKRENNIIKVIENEKNC